MTPLMIAIVIAVAVGALVYVFASSSMEKAEVRDSLRRLEGYQIQDVRDQEMLAPISERVVAPLLDGLTGVAQHFTPAGYGEKIAQKLVHAGNPPNLNVDKILVMKLLGLVSVVFWLPILVFVHFQGMLLFVGVIVLWGASFMYPDVMVNRIIEDREKQISRKLPDILDLLVISVEAGLGFEQALDRTCTAVPGALSDEFRRMLHEIRIGATRADALPRHGRPQQRHRAARLHPRHAAGGHVRCVHLPAAAFAGGRDAHQAPPPSSGEGAEGTREDAVPVGVLHLPVDLRRHPRAGHDQHLARTLR